MVKALTPLGFIKKLREYFRLRPGRRSWFRWANSSMREATVASRADQPLSAEGGGTPTA